MAKYHYINAKGEKSILPADVFVDALGSANPLAITDFESVLEQCRVLVETEFQPSREALSNVRGRWYEWILSIGYIHYRNASSLAAPKFFVTIPNVESLDIYSLYDSSVYTYIQDLRQKTAHTGVSLISSNPDFLICSSPISPNIPNVANVTTSTLIEIDGLYKDFVGKLSFSDIIGFASVKTSLRPDRRLQLSHEGALTKAFYEHLKARLWETNAPGLKYYAASMRVGPKDRKGVSTVATHSILSVNSKPESAVNELFEIKSGSQLIDFFDTILC